MSEPNASIGRASLWASLTGLVVPLLLAILATLLIPQPEHRETAYLLCGILFLILELIGLVAGLMGRASHTAKVGAIVSGTCLALTVLFAVTAISPRRAAQPPADLNQAALTDDGPNEKTQTE